MAQSSNSNALISVGEVDCGGITKCPAVQRIVQCLDYRSSLMERAESDDEEKKAVDLFTAFCDEHYAENEMLSDYIHFIDGHSDLDSVRKIASKLQFECGGVSECGGTARHFRERGGLGQNEEEKGATNFYMEQMDKLHFYLCHLEEMGLRLNTQLIENEMKPMDPQQDDQSLVDEAVKKMTKEIAAKQKVLTVDRLDAATNNKFNLSTTEQKEGRIDGACSPSLSRFDFGIC